MGLGIDTKKTISYKNISNRYTNHFYFTLLGELYRDIDNKKAKENLLEALLLAKTETDKQTIQKRINELERS